jgi:hypothetical protein
MRYYPKPYYLQRSRHYTASCVNTRNIHKTYYRSAQILLLEDVLLGAARK